MVGMTHEKGIGKVFVVLVSLILVLLAFFVIWRFLPYYVESRAGVREAEVRSNIHSIQLALERYAVDNNGSYPMILYGGDLTDTFVKADAPVNPETGHSYYLPPDDPGYLPFNGDCDVLIQYGYLAQYPMNPFQRTRDVERYGKLKTNPAENGFGPLEFHFDTHGKTRVNIWSQPFDRALYYVRRKVGGVNGNLMWEVSEGQRHAPWPIVVVPEPEPHSTGYANPQYSLIAFGHTKNYRDDYQFWLTPGNFYYYALFEGVGGYSSFVSTADGPIINAPITSAIIGYHLCGYGAVTNAGGDVYNLWGDFAERSLMTVNDTFFPGMDPEDIFTGPDGRCDGVIIVADSSTPMIQ